MILLPGYHLTVAPKFHIDANWATRVTVGAGLENLDGAFFPAGPWRAPTVAELASLTPEPTGTLKAIGENPAVRLAPTPVLPTDSICLFRIPEHLRSAWWSLLDAAAWSGGPLQGFDGFAAQVSAFLAFKGLDVPGSTRMEAVVSAAGVRSIRRDPETGQILGLGSTIPPWATWPPDQTVPRLRAIVNLGDEPSGLVLLNLPFAGAAELVRQHATEPEPTTVGELLGCFFRACPNYPPVRLVLGPAEGYWLPAGGVVLDGDPTGKTEPDVLLLISGGEPTEESEPGGIDTFRGKE